MQIISYPVHYQSVCTNFDFSLFSRISCTIKAFFLHGKVIAFREWWCCIAVRKRGEMLRKSEEKGLVQWHYLRQTLWGFLLEKLKLIDFQYFVAEERSVSCRRTNDEQCWVGRSSTSFLDCFLVLLRALPSSNEHNISSSSRSQRPYYHGNSWG